MNCSTTATHIFRTRLEFKQFDVILAKEQLGCLYYSLQFVNFNIDQAIQGEGAPIMADTLILHAETVSVYPSSNKTLV